MNVYFDQALDFLKTLPGSDQTPVFDITGDHNLKYPVAATLVTLCMYSWTMIRVGNARKTYQVPFPRTDGPEDFLRIYRTQANMTEQIPHMLALLWLFSLFVNPIQGAFLMMLWNFFRLGYILTYSATSDYYRVISWTIPAYLTLNVAFIAMVVTVGSAFRG